ncbi:MAG: hypothetical protein JWP11_1910 [Frankiales bacterium]|nr:hypothetical protein [Frankiales bacterium]
MPATEAAAALTDRYRQRVLGQRQAAAAGATIGLGAVDLDQSRQQVTSQLLRWATTAALVVVNAQTATAGLTGVYLPAYLAASRAPVQLGAPVDLTAHVGVTRGGTVDELVSSAAKGLLWRLGQGVGRDQALGYGQSLATRAAAMAVTDTATGTLTDLMVASPEVIGYRRVTSPNTCQRCADAAGHVSPPNHLLPRHPACRCTQEPVLRTAARFARPAPAVVRP